MSNETKTTRIAFFALVLWLAPVFAHSVTRVFGVWNVRQNPKIQVDLWARPLAGASVEVYRGFGPNGSPPQTKPLFVLTSGANGQVVLPKLPDGRYYILGRAKPDRTDYLYLEISPSGRVWPDLILNLDATPGSAEFVLERVGSGTHANRVSALRGVVKGPDGTPLPNADIDIFAKRLGIDQRATHLRTGSTGEFSANLPEGQYVLHTMGIWRDSSWESILLVDVSKAGTSEPLRITLHHGQSN